MQRPMTALPLAKELPAPTSRASDKEEIDNERGRGWDLLRILLLGRLDTEPMSRSRRVLITPPLDTASRRFPINVGSNLCFVILQLALMVWYIPFLVRHLGVAAYGMIPFANSMVMYAALLTSSLEFSINRFLAMDLNRGNTAHANRTFNTAFALSIATCFLLLVPIILLAYYAPVLFNVPPGLELATQWLFAGAGITTLTASLGANFGAVSVITHRFDLRNLVRAVALLSRIGIVAVCFAFWPASLWYVTIAFVISAFLNLVGDILVWRQLTPQLHFDGREIDPSQFRALFGLGGWATVNQVGLLLLLQTDLLVVNAFFGAASTGLYGSLLLLTTLFHAMTDTVTGVLSPAIFARYALGDFAGIQRLASCSIKLLGVGLALPVGLLCGFGRPLLYWWLGPEFVQLDLLLILLVGHLTITLAIRPLSYVLNAYNRVKMQGLVSVALGIGNTCLAIALARWTGWGICAVAAAASIAWTIRSAAFMTIYGAIVMDLRWWSFYPPLIAGVLGTVGIAAAGRLASHFCAQTDWLSLGVTATAISVAYTVAAYTISLNRSDRQLLWSFQQRTSHA
jgi:membrane protein EpsK